MIKKQIGFVIPENTNKKRVRRSRGSERIRPIGFLRKEEYTLSEEIDNILKPSGDPEESIRLVAEKMIKAFNKMAALRARNMIHEYYALKGEMRKIRKMESFKELVKEIKKITEENEEPTKELAEIYKNVGMCEYIVGKKQVGVKYLSYGIMTLLCIDKVEEAIEEIKNVVSLSEKETYKDSERVLKTLFKEMVDSKHPHAMTMAGVALASFYEQNKRYKDAADVYGSILVVCQTNLENKEVIENYTYTILPAFIEYKKKAGEDVMPSLLIAFDDVYHIAARNLELVYLKMLREIIKKIWNENNGRTPEETKEITQRFENYVELFNIRKKIYVIGREEFFIDEVSNFLENKRKIGQKFE